MRSTYLDFCSASRAGGTDRSRKSDICKYLVAPQPKGYKLRCN